MSEVTNSSNNVNIFELATRKGLRFNYKGSITVEDLWKLSLTALNEIATALYTLLQQTAVSFIEEQPKANAEIELKLNIVKHIISQKKNEQAEREQAAAKRAKKQQILELINQKQNEQLSALSIEQLTAQLEQL